VQWLRDGLKAITASADVEKLMAQVKDTDGVYLVPAFVGLGAPYWDPRARGVIVGLTRNSSIEHVARAAVDAMAYQTRDVLEAMQGESRLKLTTLKVDGGAAANAMLLQFQADLLNVTVRRPVVAETTERLENERRLATLRELARHAGDVQTPEQAREKAMATLAANSIDVPFSLLYLVDDDGRRARLASSTGITTGSPASPPLVDLSSRGAAWPLVEVLENRQLFILQNLPQRFGPLPGGALP